MSLIKLLFCCFQDDKIIVIYKQLKLNMIDLEYMKKNNNKMGVGLIMLVVAVIFLGFGFIYINKHNQSTNNNKKNAIQTVVKTTNDTTTTDSYDLLTKQEYQIDTNKSADALSKDIAFAISEGEFTLDDLIRLDKYYANVLFNSENGYMMMDFAVKNKSECAKFHNTSNAIIAETIRKPQKYYIKMLNQNDLVAFSKECK